MEIFIEPIGRLINEFSRLPRVGKKTAQRSGNLVAELCCGILHYKAKGYEIFISLHILMKTMKRISLKSQVMIRLHSKSKIQTLIFGNDLKVI